MRQRSIQLPWSGSLEICVSPCWLQPELCGDPPPYTGTTVLGHSGLSFQSGYCHATIKQKKDMAVAGKMIIKVTQQLESKNLKNVDKIKVLL